MHVASRALAAGADFRLIAPCVTSSTPPSRGRDLRGADRRGQEQTGRRVTQILRDAGHRVAVLRHPMPYGDLAKQAVQRFATSTTSSRRLHDRGARGVRAAPRRGQLVFAGRRLRPHPRAGRAEADVIVWEGGNNDTPFVPPRPSPRPGRSSPSRTRAPLPPGRDEPADGRRLHRQQDRSAPRARSTPCSRRSRASTRRRSSSAPTSPIEVEEGGEAITGKRVLCVEDGPTLTHGEMAYGAAVIAARQHGAAAIVDPRPFAVGSIAETFEKYPETGPVPPRDGLRGRADRGARRDDPRSDADVVLIGTPIDLRRLIAIDRPALRVRYRLEEIGEPTLADDLRRARPDRRRQRSCDDSRRARAATR